MLEFERIPEEERELFAKKLKAQTDRGSTSLRELLQLGLVLLSAAGEEIPGKYPLLIAKRLDWRTMQLCQVMYMHKTSKIRQGITYSTYNLAEGSRDKWNIDSGTLVADRIGRSKSRSLSAFSIHEGRQLFLPERVSLARQFLSAFALELGDPYLNPSMAREIEKVKAQRNQAPFSLN
jgi:hypothetical protein